MRILLVGNYALDNQSSMLRYAEMLQRQLAARGHEVELIQPACILGCRGRRQFVRKWLAYVDKYLLFPGALRRRAAEFDLVHVCGHSNSMYLAHCAGRPASITCHDLLAVNCALGRYPQQRTGATGRLLQRWILRGLLSGHSVVCVSANTARELEALARDRRRNADGEEPARVPERRSRQARGTRSIVVIPNALTEECAPASAEEVQELRARLGLAPGERYLFHIGGNLWYKNRLGVLRIFSHLLRRPEASGLRLAMAGAPFTPEMREFATRRLPPGSLIEVTRPEDSELWALYTGAHALLFPSLHEGFGWPLAEAQRCGCPVITSNRAPMTEVAASAALYIDPADEGQAAAKIAEHLDWLPSLRESGFENAGRFAVDRILPMYEGFFLGVLRARRSTD